MRQALCYRVETSDGSGMYTTDFTMDFYLYEEDTHPRPSDDTALGWKDDMGYRGSGAWKFGFASIDQMRRWIYKEGAYAAMADYDLAISVYLCDEYQIGDTQMVFRTATKVGRFNLQE